MNEWMSERINEYIIVYEFGGCGFILYIKRVTDDEDEVDCDDDDQDWIEREKKIELEGWKN